MKAVVVEAFGPPDSMVIKELPVPTVAGGQVRVKVQAVSIGFVDTLKVQGLYQTKDQLPFTPTMEFAGIVDAVSEGVSGLSPGQSVLGIARNGALAEYVVAQARDLMVLPDGLDPVTAAAFRSNYFTSLYALERGQLRPGEYLLVLGASGGTGISAVQIGKLLGARVIGAASTAEKRQFAVRHGADATVDYTQPNWRDTLKDLTGGRGPDLIYDPVGGDVAIQAFRSIAWNGRHVVVGFASGKISALPLNLALLKGGILLGVDVVQIAKEPGGDQLEKRLLAGLVGWLKDGRLKPVVGQVFEFENFKDAFKALTSRTAVGKMVVKIGS